MPTRKRRPQLKQADQMPLVAYSDEEEGEGGFTLTGEEAMSGSLPSAASTSGLPAMDMPCTLQGLTSGASGGALGYVFGFGGTLIKHKGKGRWQACNKEGLGSAKTFAIMGGLYTAASCISKRIRQQDDAWNGFASGCVTGAVLAWGGSPRTIAQNALGFGVFSYFIDRLGSQQAATASSLTACSGSSCSRQQRQQIWPLHCASCSAYSPTARVPLHSDDTAPVQRLLRHPAFAQPLLTPAALWLQPLQAVATQYLSGLQQNGAQQL